MFLLPACLFLLVLGLKLDVIHRFGSDLPNWDQWDAEGLTIYAPWAEHRLGITDFFRPHNEHRIVLTKLLGFCELLINGQWDARLQCVVNALLHCSLAAVIFLVGQRHLPHFWRPVLFALVALLFGLPLAWQNVLGGFHSPQYFLLGLSFGTLCLLPFASPWSGRWWAGAACAVLALFSMGSGLFAAAVVIPLVILRCWLGRLALRSFWPTLSFCAAVVLVGWLSRVTVPAHEGLKAHSLGEFVLYTIHNLQWPSSQYPWLAVVGWAPWVILLLGLFFRHDKFVLSDHTLIIIGLGGWVLLQILASAYVRGAGAEMPANRYLDTLALGMLTNALALAWLASRAAKLFRYSLHAFAMVWLATLGWGLWEQIQPIYRDVMPEVRRRMAGSERNVRCYLSTGDVTCLQVPYIPYPSASVFRERIDVPALQAIMPVSVRRPLRLDSYHPGPFRLHDTLPRPPKPYDPDIARLDPSLEPTGLSPSTPSLEHARTWGSYGSSIPGEWVGLSINVQRRTYLRFLVAGKFGSSGTSLILRDATLGFRVAQVQSPPVNSPAAWESTEVFVPGGRLELQARLEDATHWFAFSEPVEMAMFSHWAAQAVQAGHLLWPFAAALAVLLWCLDWLLPRRG